MGSSEDDEVELAGLELMYEIGVAILKVPINKEYIPIPILLVTAWELSINSILDPSCTADSE
jgi:hypothetical protein